MAVSPASLLSGPRAGQYSSGGGQMGMDRWMPRPGVSAPLRILRVPLLLLSVVNFQQVLLHAVGDLRAQMPDEHAAAEARERCGRGRNSDYGATWFTTAKTPFPGPSQKTPHYLSAGALDHVRSIPWVGCRAPQLTRAPSEGVKTQGGCEEGL